MPFATAWMGQNHAAPVPTACYGIVLLGAAVAYIILQTAIAAEEGCSSRLRAAVGADLKGKLSMAMYVAAIPLALVDSWIAVGIYVLVALIWLVPDRRIETRVRSSSRLD